MTRDQHRVSVTPFEVRPRFEMWTHLKPHQIAAALQDYLSSDQAQCTGKVRSSYASLQPEESIRHYWSPHVSITFEPDEDGEDTHIRGLYGPAPPVWTMFIFFYAVIGLLVLIVSVIGTANLQIGNSATILWALPFLVLAFFSLYIVSFTGQRKGHDQVEGLHRVIEACVQPYKQK